MKERFGREEKRQQNKRNPIRTNFFSMETQKRRLRKEKLSSRFKKPICVG
jgi:hypothetical protein